MGNQTIAIALEVDDKGTVVVKKFSKGTVDKVKQMSDKSIGHVKRLSAKFTKGLGGAISGIGRALTSLKTLAVGALAGWGVTKVLTEFATFESALVDMGKVTTESYDSIKKKIMELPPELGSATEMVKGYYQVISAGVKGAVNQLDTLTTASKLAKTAHADQAQVIVGLSSVMDAFKTESMEAADALQTMEKTGKTTVAGLIPVIGELSSSSAALGIGLNEMGAAFAAVTLQSGGTEKAATQYKALLTSLLAPTEGMTELLGMYGGAQNAIKKIGFGGVLKLIKDETGGNAEATKKLVGSVEAYLGFLSASANDMATYNANLEEQKNKTGAVEKAWKDFEKTLNAIWDTFQNTIGKQVILIGEKLAPAIKSAISAISGLLKKYRELITLKFEEWINNVLGGFARLIEGIAWVVGKIYFLNGCWHAYIQMLAAVGAALTDVAAAFLLLDPINAYKAAIYGLRDTFPVLAEMRDKFDKIGVSHAQSVEVAIESIIKYKAYGDQIRGAADSVRGLITAQDEAGESAQDMATVSIAAAEEMSQKMVAASNRVSDATKKVASVQKQTIGSTTEVIKEQNEEIEKTGCSWSVAADEINFAGKKVLGMVSTLDEAISQYTKRINGYLANMVQAQLEYMRLIAQAGSVSGGVWAQTLKNARASYDYYKTSAHDAMKELGLYKETLKDFWGDYPEYKESVFNVKFVGEGSSVAPLSEKIQEMTLKTKEFYDMVESTMPKVTIDFTESSRTLSAGEAAARGLGDAIKYSAKELEHFERIAKGAIGNPWADYDSRYSYVGGSQRTQGMTIPGYQHGTGPTGLPYTGLFFGHKSEIVIPPGQSSKIRNQNTTIGDVHIHVPANVAPQSAQDWRYITREVIIPELKKAAY